MLRKQLKYYLILLFSMSVAYSHGISQSMKTNPFGDQDKVKVELSVYPNPAYDFFTLNTNQEVKQISIYNIIGKEVKTYVSNPDNQYDLSELKRGIYILRIFGKDDHLIKAIRLSKS